MSRKVYFILFFVISLFNYFYSQEYNQGVIIEAPFWGSELHYQKYQKYLHNEDDYEKIEDYYEDRLVYGIVISYSWRFPLFLDNKLELRPGIYLGDLDISGIDFDLYIRSFRFWNLFIIIGSKLHYNFGNEDRSHYFSDSSIRSSPSGLYIFPGASIGLAISERVSILAGYYRSLRHNWRSGSSYKTTPPSWIASSSHTLTRTNTTEKLYWMVKVGIEINH